MQHFVVIAESDEGVEVAHGPFFEGFAAHVYGQRLGCRFRVLPIVKVNKRSIDERERLRALQRDAMITFEKARS